MTRIHLAFVSSFALLLICSSGVSAQEAGWVLTQRSDVMGDQYIYVSANGFKWVNPKAGANVVSCGPQWGVIMFNDKTKSMYRTTFREWQNQISARRNTSAHQMQNSNWVKAGSASIAGLRATKYVMKGQPQAVVNGTKKTLASVRNAACWVADDISVPPNLANMLSATYGMPKTRFFPLRVAYMDARGQKKVALDTYRSQQFNVPADFYNGPSGYALANSYAEVLMDDETKQILRDMVADVDSPGQQSRAPVQRRAAQPAAKPVPAATTTTKPAQGGDPLSKLLQRLQGK